jgi:hypothetical protein
VAIVQTQSQSITCYEIHYAVSSLDNSSASEDMIQYIILVTYSTLRKSKSKKKLESVAQQGEGAASIMPPKQSIHNNE